MNNSMLTTTLLLAAKYFLLDDDIEEEASDSAEDDHEDIRMVLVVNGTKNKQHRIQNYVEVTIKSFTSTQFQQNFRITCDNYETLLQVVMPQLQKQTHLGRSVISVEKQILSVLWLLATPDSFRSVGERFDMPKSSLSKYFFKIVRILCQLAPTIIKWPSEAEKVTIKAEFRRMGGFGDAIGAVDGTYIVIKAPQQDAEVYITRKCDYAIILEGVCRPSLQFIDVFVGYPGSCNDNRVFRNSQIFKDIQANLDIYITDNEYLLGDKAYPVLTWCIPPYINRGNITASKRYFNTQLAKTRQTVERSFALLFGRFRRLKFLDMNRTELIPATVLACCVLHNICKSPTLQEEFIAEGRAHLQQIHGPEDIAVEENDIGPTIPAAQLIAGRIKRDNMCHELFVNRR